MRAGRRTSHAGARRGPRHSPRSRGRFHLRLLAAALVAATVVPAFALSPELAASAAPSRADVESAKAELASLNEHLSLLVEQYDQAKLQLAQTKGQLVEARSVQADAQAEAQAVLSELAGRASDAYMERGSQLGMLLGAGSFSDFSDRLAFVDRLQQADADVALAADAVTQRARWAADQLAKVQAQRSAVLERLRQRSVQIQQGIDRQQALVAELGERYRRAVDRRKAAREAAAKRAEAVNGRASGEGTRQGGATAGNDGDRTNGANGGSGGSGADDGTASSGGGSGGGTGGGDGGGGGTGGGGNGNGGGGNGNSGGNGGGGGGNGGGGNGNGGGNGGGGGSGGTGGAGARAAISAAYTVIGTRYVWGGSTPRGFDCSGLTMWAWAHGGVSLSHSSAGQYAQLPHVSRGGLRPGDLVFFYRPIHHVGLYIGGGRMIDASHPGPGGEVAIRPVNWGAYAGAARP
jgi:cell wall-associated NlpC family hydrolase